MGSSQRFWREYGRTFWSAQELARSFVSLVALVVAGLAAWKLGLAWGVAILLAVMFLLAVVTGLSFARQLEGLEGGKRERRVELIERWTRMVARHAPPRASTYAFGFPPSIVNDEDWPSLRSHLSPGVIGLCETHPSIESPLMGDHVTVVSGAGGAAASPYLAAVMSDIDRIRASWGID